MVNYIVSGCPRSGTSMTMRILFNAGMPIAKDDKREADHDNRHGYFEIDDIVNKIKDNPEIVFEYDDKVLKVIHYGIQFFPKGNYKIIFIERDLDEVMASMEKMMGKPDPKREETKQIFSAFNKKARKLLEEREDIDFIVINHRDLINDAEPVIEKIIEFYAIDPEKKQKMMEAIDPELYRNRAK